MCTVSVLSWDDSAPVPASSDRKGAAGASSELNLKRSGAGDRHLLEILGRRGRRPLPSSPTARIRIACNRDELRTRPSALPPQVRQFGGHQAILPIDPVSDGTWISVNDAGVVATLLNTYTGPAEASRSRRDFELEKEGSVNRRSLVSLGRRGRRPLRSTPRSLDRSTSRELEDDGRRAGAGVVLRSRGVIVPALMQSLTARGAADIARELDPASFPPFRVAIVDEDAAFHLRSDGEALGLEEIPDHRRPLLFTSSGLGDDVVEPPRRALFDEMFPEAREAIPDPSILSARQDAFHRHRWPDRPHLSVCMERDGARTVSLTVVEIAATEVSLTYYPDAPDRGPSPIRMALGRRPRR